MAALTIAPLLVFSPPQVQAQEAGSVPATIESAPRTMLVAAGDSLWTFALPKRDAGDLRPAARPLPAAAVTSCRFGSGQVALATHSGLFVVDFEKAPQHPQIKRTLPGAPVRALERAPDGGLFVLIREPGRPREPCEVRRISPDLRDDVHIAEVAPAARQLAFAPKDSSLWIFQEYGRIVEKVSRGNGDWRIETVALAEVGQHAPPAHWSLQFVANLPEVGTIVLEQGRGLTPTLLGLEPPRALWSWPRGALILGAAVNRNGEVLALNGASHILLVDTSDWTERAWKPPAHVMALAVSDDAVWLASAMEFEPGRSRIELLNLMTGVVTPSRDLGSGIGGLEFLEVDR